MKILYLTFYFEPDLCAGSFRNTALVKALAHQLNRDDFIHVVTTQPNRYKSFQVTAPVREERTYESGARVLIERIAVPSHASGLMDQIRSFWSYYQTARQLTRKRSYDLVVASSSRLFTAFLGAQVARRQNATLFLDIRDLCRETILEMVKRGRKLTPLLRFGLEPVLAAVEQYTFSYASHINLVSEGFKPYFEPFRHATYSYFTNGIDDEFLALSWSTVSAEKPANTTIKRILYAGNIGQGQGLHTIIPEAARRLGATFQFVVIGDGGAKSLLEKVLREERITNVALLDPVGRNELLGHYKAADYLFVHLNDLDAFKRVLPSKLFDYGATDKPILAGVAGYAAQFIRQHISNCIVFDPGDADSLVTQLYTTPYSSGFRPDFIAQFQRKTIMQAMARQILQTKLASTDYIKPVAI